MNSDAGNTPSRALGSPIRTPSDHSSFGNSPRLIAAYYVLHRLLVPRHPPCALTHLHSQNNLKMLASTVQFSNNTHQPPHPPHTSGRARISARRNNQPTQQRAGRCFRHPTVCFRLSDRLPSPPPGFPDPDSTRRGSTSIQRDSVHP